MYAFTPRMYVFKREGIWWLDTGVATIPHPTWRDAWHHAEFIHRIRNEV